MTRRIDLRLQYPAQYKEGFFMKKQTKIFLLLVAALCLLTACKKELESLEVYSLGESEEDNVTALDTILEPDEAMLYSIDAPTDKAVAEGLEISHTYHYRQMADPAILAAKYIAFLREEEQGLTLLDSENHRVLEDPDTDLLYGTVILGKTAAANEEAGKRIVRVVVGWSEYSLAVQVAYIKGSILAPVTPPKEEDPNDPNGQGGQSTPKPTSISEQVDYFTSLSPSQLGLEGEKMSDYIVYPGEGWVTVDDINCREIRVYQMDTRTATNVLVGTYYLSNDLTNVYQKNGEGQITKLQITNGD